ncbi:MAG: DUF934 domain-containing protein [Burkholderiales bacterium]|nr:DUF934 domain-containing protein [Burkholderiales bacterium]
MTHTTLQFIDLRQDPWRKLQGEDGPISHPVPAAKLLLSLAQWHAVRGTWPEGLPVGVHVTNDSDIAALAEDLPRLALVALHFPTWVDGRAYSQAHLLRSRYRYKGALRATGEVLVDMVPMLARTGFSEAALRADQDVADAQRALNFFPAFYQGDVAQTAPWFARQTQTP